MADKTFGIDISRWQGDYNIKQAKKEGVQFVIAKIGGGDDGLYKDRQFEANYQKCKKAKIPIGCYFYSDATTMDAAKREAAFLLELLKDHQFEFPIFWDIEGRVLRMTNRTQLTEIVNYECATIEAAGYWVGIYSSQSSFNTELNDRSLARYSHWVACWNRGSVPKLNSGNEVQMHQFGGETNLVRSNKVAGKVTDQNYCWIDYPRWIKAAGLNNFPKPKKKTTTKAKENKK